MTAFTTQPKPSHTCTTSPWARDQNSRGCHVSCKITAFCNTLQPAPDVDACTSCARASCVQPVRASLGDTPLQWASPRASRRRPSASGNHEAIGRSDRRACRIGNRIQPPPAFSENPRRVAVRVSGRVLRPDDSYSGSGSAWRSAGAVVMAHTVRGVGPDQGGARWKAAGRSPERLPLREP